MKLVGYPARFFRDPEEENIILVEFAGLGGSPTPLCTYGESPEHAREMAVECLTGYILSADSRGILEYAREPKEGEELVIPDLPVALALTIRKMRQLSKLNQGEAARKTGVSQQTYRRWEHPELCNATAETIEKIAKAFGRRVDLSFPEAV